jgi:pyruvate, water dikinase
MSTETLVNEYVSDISALRLSDAGEAGGKGANMGELVAAGLPVPPGFVLMRSSCLASSARAESNAPVRWGLTALSAGDRKSLMSMSRTQWGG